jgi:hypothetical protein
MARHVAGIDLGTTNCAMALRDLAAPSEPGAAGESRVLGIPQLTAVGVIEERSLLPSFLYLPQAGEFPPGGLALPWSADAGDITGEFARAHGVKVPSRLVASAKSWLGHAGVDRNGALLPWQAPPDVARVSPVEASARYLRHLLSAAGAGGWGDAEVVLTVPASFDAAARDLTLAAARQAGLTDVHLLEEPQAALYAWLERMGDRFRKALKVGEVILVVDVGGGTTDFSLIAVTERAGEVELTRLAVGDHILLGGDNMDLALAHTLNQRLAAAGRKLDAWQFASLTHAARQGKERLFGDPKLAKVPVTVPGRGSALVGGTIKAELEREELTRVLTDGFFPRVSVGELPQTARRTGLTQVALPYAADPGITRHLAAFLTRQARALGRIRQASEGLPGRGGRARAEVRAPHGGVVQRRRVPGGRAEGARARGVERVAAGGRRRAGPGTGGGRPRSRGRARRGLLRLGAARARNPDPGRHGARLLRRGGTADAGGAGLRTARARALRRAVRDGRGNPGGRAAARSSRWWWASPPASGSSPPRSGAATGSGISSRTPSVTRSWRSWRRSRPVLPAVSRSSRGRWCRCSCRPS